MSETLSKRLIFYQITAIFSVIFALAGFSYNVWRMEITETNSNIRTASFEMLTELAELEQIVYAAAYDNDVERGNPRVGWVKVGLVLDLSMLTASTVENEATALKAVWSEHWPRMGSARESANAIVDAIDRVRAELKELLAALD